MPSFRNERRVRHRPDQMFDLVADIERYPEFVPLCTGTRVRNRRPDSHGRETLLSEMSVGYRVIRETFTTRVLLDKPRHRILVEYIDGPFRYLENIWTFREDGEPSRSIVTFFIDYEFRSRALGALMGSMFDAAFRKFSQAFEERADKIYSGKGAL